MKGGNALKWMIVGAIVSTLVGRWLNMYLDSKRPAGLEL